MSRRAIAPPALLSLSLAFVTVAQSSMEPLSQTRQVVAFAIAVNPDTFAVDEVEIEAVDFGLFEESVELTMSCTATADVAPAGAPPVMLSAHPNPTRGTVTFEIGGTAGQRTVLTIFDVAGRRVRSLTVGGLGNAIWDGLTDDGNRVVPGVYFYRLHHDASGSGRRIVVLN